MKRTKYENEKTLLLYIIIILAIIIFSYFIIITYLNTDDFMVTVLSDSMEPTLYRGDITIIKSETTYNIDDIIVFEQPDGIYIHRIIAEREGFEFRTAGDRTGAPDQWSIIKEDIKGKVILTIPKAGHINLWLAGK